MLYQIARADLLAFLDAEPSRYRDIMAYENFTRQTTQEGFVRALTTSGEARVASMLLGLFEVDWLKKDMPVSFVQNDFAALAGVSIPTVQRAFRRMKADGVLETQYGRLIVRDVDALRKIADAPEE